MPRPFGRGHRLVLLWKKDSNLHGAVSSSAMCGGQPQSDPILVGAGITLCLFWIPTPETRGHVCQISSLHILAIQPDLNLSLSRLPIKWPIEAKLKKWLKCLHFLNKNFFYLKIIQIFT